MNAYAIVILRRLERVTLVKLVTYICNNIYDIRRCFESQYVSLTQRNINNGGLAKI